MTNAELRVEALGMARTLLPPHDGIAVGVLDEATLLNKAKAIYEWLKDGKPTPTSAPAS